MAKIRFTKNELKKQKDDLKRFSRYLPALQLKKQQLQLEISKILKNLSDIETEINNFKNSVNEWIDVFAEKYDIKRLLTVSKVNTRAGNIAGVDILILENIEFKEKEYDLINTPLWLDYGLIALKKMITLKINQDIFQQQLKAVREELKIITQRVNLFEEVKIPEAEENIKRIQIYLGDSYTAAVVIGKIAKDKIERKAGALVS